MGYRNLWSCFMSKIKLRNILKIESYMKILIDDEVLQDNNGNYLINVGYERVSTDRQAEMGFGLDIQEKDIYNHAKSNGFTNFVVFIDDGFTGTNMERPALSAIISMIKMFNEGKTRVRINTMVIPRIDRLGRTLLGTLQFIQDYIVSKEDSKNSVINNNKEDINFISVAENYCRIERNNPQGKFLLMLFASLAEFDRDTIVDKLQKGRLERVSSGKWLGGGVKPIGYRYDKTIGKLTIVPAERERLHEAKRLLIEEKLSLQKVAELTGFKSDTVLRNALRRKSLAGYIEYKGHEFLGEHEPIFTLEEWTEIQEELDKRSVFRGDPMYLLTGLLYCGECGAKLRYFKWNKTGECKLVCYSQDRSKKHLVKDENCALPKYWQSDVESAVINELFKMSYLGVGATKTETSYDPIKIISDELRKAERQLSRLYDFDDDGSDDILKEKIIDTRQRINALKIKLQNENQQKTITRKITKAKALLKNLEATWQSMTKKEQQSVCRELIDRIVVYANGTIDVKLKINSFIENSK